MSNQTGISSTEIADNVYNAISAGQSTGDAVNFVSNSTKLAKAGFAEAGDALDILTTILNAYGMEASEVTNVSDMLIQTHFFTTMERSPCSAICLCTRFTLKGVLKWYTKTGHGGG